MPSDAQREHDERLAAEALRKQKAGAKPKRDELAALVRVRAAREEEDRWKHYRSVPKKHYISMSGRQQKVLDEQSARYGLPAMGPSVDLAAVLRWFHDFLSDNGPLLIRTVGQEGLNGDAETSPALERLREETFLLKRLERLQLEKELLPRGQIHEMLVAFASGIRSCGEQLQRQFGPEALEILNDAVGEAERTIEELLGTEPAASGEGMKESGAAQEAQEKEP